MDVACPQTGEVRTAQLFIATLGASNYTYVEASWTQTLPDWISSHVRAFDFFGGVAAQVVPDNLKAGVTKACFYDPAINRTYGDMAAHGACPRAGKARTGEYRHRSRPAIEAERQGKGRRGRAFGRAVDYGPFTQPAFLLT